MGGGACGEDKTGVLLMGGDVNFRRLEKQKKMLQMDRFTRGLGPDPHTGTEQDR